MLKFYNFDIVFQEIPDETTLAVNITGCPFRCEGCHSPHLREDIGEPLTEEALRVLSGRYAGITCVALMGGDADPAAVSALGGFIRQGLGLKSAWYSGAEEIPEAIDRSHFDFIKIGPYRAEAGGLKDPHTNQRLYAVRSDGTLEDITDRIRRKAPFPDAESSSIFE
ncbi:MAG: anaerobic ribonucleoside-triphosphate reductase activating protein [Bacteroidales bacterium]|jgi:anaerobic ribonucleoside-triphosphate reductase activating protein|nr:anaerobic ribonucleoside-triphosphate reductase activating protein [Bacteroidales bacterium]